MNRPDNGIKYVLHPSKVRSREDGNLHFIDAPQLAGLWGVKLGQCAVVLESEVHSPWLRREGVVHLYPDASGVYDKSQIQSADAPTVE